MAAARTLISTPVAYSPLKLSPTIQPAYPAKTVLLHLVEEQAPAGRQVALSHDAGSLVAGQSVLLIGPMSELHRAVEELHQRSVLLVGTLRTDIEPSGAQTASHSQTNTSWEGFHDHGSVGRLEDTAAGAAVLGTIAELDSVLHRLHPQRVILVGRVDAATLGRIERSLRNRSMKLDYLDQPMQTDVATAHSAAVVPQPRVDYARLIGRKPHQPDTAAVGRVITGKRVLITGAGGSIGSELCKVACAYNPAQIILVERSENALFEIDRQLATRFPKIERKVFLHDVVDERATLRLAQKLQPQVVFHAAAHKHVPLMENHPGQAVTNNLFGTKSIADASVAVGAERFVLISSDKAVNPVSVMGATKRLAELYVRHLAHRVDRGEFSNTQGNPRTRLSMVRFGNVIGSACSVLTIWAQQITDGGPMTVTDPRMTRYFMTIPEAATLVIQAAALETGTGLGSDQGGNGSVYVLDMGEPIRIVDLALRYADMLGLRVRMPEDGGPGRHHRLAGNQSEINLIFTGTRPGEKLYEELAYASEMLLPTAHPGIKAWRGERALGDIPLMIREMDELRLGGGEGSELGTGDGKGAIIAALQRHIPEMRRSCDIPADN